MIRMDDHSLEINRARWAVRRALIASVCVMTTALSILSVQPAGAQAQATLVGRAILPAAQLADGPASGNALVKSGKTINGIDLPFMSQPLGNISGIWPGQYGSWLLLTGTAFDNRTASSDVLLRLYTAQIDWALGGGNGSGQVTAVDWITLNDQLNKLTTALVVPDDSRSLTGADFSPHGIATTDNGKTWWLGDNALPALLHINAKGNLLIPPRVLQGVTADNLQGIAITPSGSVVYVISASDATHLSIQAQQLTTGEPQGSPLSYNRDQAADRVLGWVMINETQALAVESDGKGGTSAAIKRVYLVDFSKVGSDGTVQKTLIADLMHLSDPNQLGIAKNFGDASGQIGLNPFTYPFEDISGVFPASADTLVIVNNNHVPYLTARKAKTAENTELIEVKLSAPLDGITLPLGQ